MREREGVTRGSDSLFSRDLPRRLVPPSCPVVAPSEDGSFRATAEAPSEGESRSTSSMFPFDLKGLLAIIAFT